ncbi:hypothetical protein EBF04_14385 [Streptomyces sp. I6]|nr:hypothetical protein [Streptomyces sp. I6]RNL74173.1 hypothetical protein EBF04_14385 [Streptomyces sp. I6]
MTLIMVLFWVLVIAGAVALARYIGRRRQEPNPQPPVGEQRWGGRRAEDLLAQRFASGDIEEDEYGRRLALLRESR